MEQDCDADLCTSQGLLTQNKYPTPVSYAGLACYNETQERTQTQGWARCFHLRSEGCETKRVIDSVTFGVERATRDGLRFAINIYKDKDGCESEHNIIGEDVKLLHSQPLTINKVDPGLYPGPATLLPPVLINKLVVVCPKDSIWVELELLENEIDPFWFWPGASNHIDGDCGKSYIRSTMSDFRCGPRVNEFRPEWESWEEHAGYPEFDLILEVHTSPYYDGSSDDDNCSQESQEDESDDDDDEDSQAESHSSEPHSTHVRRTFLK